MSETKNRSGVGVIVARMQVAAMTEGHRALIKNVLARHKKVIVFLGCNGTASSTKNNPLDFQSRKLMITNGFHDVEVERLKDSFCDILWSKQLDNSIREAVTIGSDVTLYGSRDSFIQYYAGSFKTEVLKEVVSESGTKQRNNIKDTLNKDSKSFREGAIWATQNQYPTAYPVIDAAVIDSKQNLILLGRKPGEKKWRLPGGFVDPQKGFSSGVLEATVIREVMEETGVVVNTPEYIGSFFVEDWRYNSEPDCIMSVLFMAEYESGVARADDDLEEVCWFSLNTTTAAKIGPKSHQEMFEAILESELKRNNMLEVAIESEAQRKNRETYSD